MDLDLHGKGVGGVVHRTKGIAEQLAFRRAGARVAPELASQELLPLAPVGLPPLKVQIPVLELRASWTGREVVFQRMGILTRMVEGGRVERAWQATTEDTLTHTHTHTFLPI